MTENNRFTPNTARQTFNESPTDDIPTCIVAKTLHISKRAKATARTAPCLRFLSACRLSMVCIPTAIHEGIFSC